MCQQQAFAFNGQILQTHVYTHTSVKKYLFFLSFPGGWCSSSWSDVSCCKKSDICFGTQKCAYFIYPCFMMQEVKKVRPFLPWVKIFVLRPWFVLLSASSCWFKITHGYVLLYFPMKTCENFPSINHWRCFSYSQSKGLWPQNVRLYSVNWCTEMCKYDIKPV